jgi:hypothetical protein
MFNRCFLFIQTSFFNTHIVAPWLNPSQKARTLILAPSLFDANTAPLPGNNSYMFPDILVGVDIY